MTDTTKTKKSQRTLKFSDAVMEMLHNFKKEQEAEIEMLGDKWVYTDRIFVGNYGKPINSNTPYKWFREFCTENNLKFCDIHSLRHHNTMKTHLSNLKYTNKYIPLHYNPFAILNIARGLIT